jgi:hypothetical protein
MPCSKSLAAIAVFALWPCCTFGSIGPLEVTAVHHWHHFPVGVFSFPINFVSEVSDQLIEGVHSHVAKPTVMDRGFDLGSVQLVHIGETPNYFHMLIQWDGTRQSRRFAPTWRLGVQGETVFRNFFAFVSVDDGQFCRPTEFAFEPSCGLVPTTNTNSVLLHKLLDVKRWRWSEILNFNPSVRLNTTGDTSKAYFPRSIRPDPWSVFDLSFCELPAHYSLLSTHDPSLFVIDVELREADKDQCCAYGSLAKGGESSPGIRGLFAAVLWLLIVLPISIAVCILSKSRVVFAIGYILFLLSFGGPFVILLHENGYLYNGENY